MITVSVEKSCHKFLTPYVYLISAVNVTALGLHVCPKNEICVILNILHNCKSIAMEFST